MDKDPTESILPQHLPFEKGMETVCYTLHLYCLLSSLTSLALVFNRLPTHCIPSAQVPHDCLQLSTSFSVCPSIMSWTYKTADVRAAHQVRASASLLMTPTACLQPSGIQCCLQHIALQSALVFSRQHMISCPSKLSILFLEDQRCVLPVEISAMGYMCALATYKVCTGDDFTAVE